MSDLNPFNFSNRDLQNRSFRGRNLNGTDFSGSDIRGCDFSYSQLVEANFEGVRAGQTSRQVLFLSLMAGIMALISANGVARLIFASLGQTPDQPAWFSVVMLHLFSGAAATGLAGWGLLGLNSRVGRVGMYVSGICAGALTTFFYAGSYSDKNAQGAIAGAIVGAGLVTILSLVARRLTAILILAMGAVAAYGFSFLIWTVAIACLNTQRSKWGFCLGALSLASVWFVVYSVWTVGYGISQQIGTSFRGANITNARFEQANLKNTDFSGVIGHPRI